jgi:SAM-dependent methyltransferase
LVYRYSRFPLPGDLTGKSVLDIGAWDGWFSFEAEKRGAKVTAIDVVEIPNFLLVHELTGSQVDYRAMDMYELPAAKLGKFDYVFFLGILYHVKHPLLALEIVCSLTRDVAIVESFVIDGDSWQDHRSDIPSMEFYEHDELGGHFDNWIGPTVGCLMALCRSAGFARVELIEVNGVRAAVACFRRWEPNRNPTATKPELIGVFNAFTGGINFRSSRDEYATWWFKTDEATPSREDVMLEVDGYGLPATSLHHAGGNTWCANSRMLPDITPGWKTVRVGTARGGFSDPGRIAVDVEPRSERVAINGACDGQTWKKAELDFSNGVPYLSIWVEGLGDNCDRSNIFVFLGGKKMLIDFLGEPDANGVRQVNAKLSRTPAESNPSLVIEFGGVRSEPVSISLVNRA